MAKLRRKRKPTPNNTPRTEQTELPKGPPVLLKGKKPACMLVDGDIVLFHATTANLVEKYDRRTDEYSWRLHRETCRAEFTSRIMDLAAWMKAKKVIVAFSGRECFRKRIHPGYKAHRTVKKPLGYYDMVEWALAAGQPWHGWRIDKLEADDVLGVFATGPNTKKEFTPVIVSDDKDLDTVPGLHLKLKGGDGMYDVTPSQARTNHLSQTLSGDAGDGYHGLKGVGPVRAEAILGRAGNSAAKQWSAVVEAYKEAGLTADDALRNARCAFILHHGYYDFAGKSIRAWDPPSR